MLDKASLSHFREHLSDESQIDSYNRVYLWHILYDHVRTLKLYASEFIFTIQHHILAETETTAIDFILAKASYIFKNGLLCLDYANLVKGWISPLKAILDKKIVVEFKNVAKRNMLLDYSILWTNLNEKDASYDFIDMVKTMQLQVGPTSEDPVVNKSQRYLCLRRLCADGHDISDDVEVEKARNFSADDLIEINKIEASRP